MKKKVLVVADVNWWAFEKIYQGLKTYSKNYEIDSCYIIEGSKVKYKNINHEKYDIVLYLCDYLLETIINDVIPKNKLIFCLRQEKNFDFLIKNKIFEHVLYVSASNEKLYEKCKKLNYNVFLTPGGVDTKKFKFKERSLPEKIRIGWSGSCNANFGKIFRGVDIIEKTCNKMNLNFNPAIREIKLRNESEMIKYYENEIDIYIDMSESAGRQNGLIEAGASGIPIISSKVGIAEKLIINEYNGYLCDRNEFELEKSIEKILLNYNKISKNIRKTIEEKWSWEYHVKLFEDMFENIK